MAFDIKTFTTRATTAAIFVLLMLAALFWNGWSYLALLTLVHFGCWYEFIALLKKIKPANWKGFAFTGLLYITLPVFFLILYGFPSMVNGIGAGKISEAGKYSPLIPCAIIFSIWINDTMAYIVGSLIGKTPMSSISPKKTWEGTLGGAILCVGLITLAGYYSKWLRPLDWLVISVCCAVFGTIGDLLESKLKRLAGVKDSGSIMPGHGGFLDRFDSLLIAVLPVSLYFLQEMAPGEMS